MPSELSDAFKSMPANLYKKQLDLNSIQELPDSHAWASLGEHPCVDPLIAESVPVIDLSDPNALTLVGDACKSWGVFQVVNHGIPISLLEAIEDASRDLFALPAEQKLKATRPPDGFSGFGQPRIAPFFAKQMWYEGFTVLGSPLELVSKLWPEEYCTKFCEVTEEYDKQMKQLANKLLWLLLGSLGINKEDVEWAGPEGQLEGAHAALQLNSYPACPQPDKAMGLAEHTDSSLLTILYQGSTSGLQVVLEGSGWITVPPLPGALVVNIGDLLHILSNAAFPSVLHRAMVNNSKQRISVAYFYGPPATIPVAPIPKLVDSSHPPVYRSVTWSEFLATKAKHFNKALSLVRMPVPETDSSE
ncbi:hypothetical protein AAG906_014748 [Vitis piasezkii]